MNGKENWHRKVSAAVLDLGKLVTDDDADCKVIIETSTRQVNRLISALENCQGKVHRELEIVPSITAQLPRGAIPAIARRADIRKIWLDTPVYAMQDNIIAGLGTSAAHEAGYTGKGVVVAALDTGIFPHEDLTRPENRILAWCDVVHGQRKPYDDNGHGTYVAGIIAGNGQTSDGKFRGMAPEARLVGVKVLDENGSGRLSDLLAGIEWCLLNQATLNVRIINLSLGTQAQGDYTRDPLCRAVSKAIAQGVLVCASAGNDAYLTQVDSPGINPDLIAVGNCQNDKTLNGDDFRNNKNKKSFNRVIPDMVAPGTAVTSLDTKGAYGTLSGASAAAPIISGAVALMIQKRPNIGPARIKRVLKETATDLGIGINLQGAGEINLEKLFGSSRPKRKPETPQSSLNPELLKTIIGLIGQNIGGGDRGKNDLLSSMVMSILKGYNL